MARLGRHYTEQQLDVLARNTSGGDLAGHLKECVRCRILNSFLVKFYRSFAEEISASPYPSIDAITSRRPRQKIRV